MTIKFHNLDLQDTKENKFKIETMSFISDIGMCDMPSYDMTYKYRTIRDLEAVLKYNPHKLLCNNIVLALPPISLLLPLPTEGTQLKTGV